jgi:hypothetical protein
VVLDVDDHRPLGDVLCGDQTRDPDRDDDDVRASGAGGKVAGVVVAERDCGIALHETSAAPCARCNPAVAPPPGAGVLAASASRK